MVIEIEGAGFNDTECRSRESCPADRQPPQNNCANFAKDAAGGGAAIAKFVPIAFNSTAERLAPLVSGGYKLTATDALAMLDLCSCGCSPGLLYADRRRDHIVGLLEVLLLVHGGRVWVLLCCPD